MATFQLLQNVKTGAKYIRTDDIATPTKVTAMSFANLNIMIAISKMYHQQMYGKKNKKRGVKSHDLLPLKNFKV